MQTRWNASFVVRVRACEAFGLAFQLVTNRPFGGVLEASSVRHGKDISVLNKEDVVIRQGRFQVLGSSSRSPV